MFNIFRDTIAKDLNKIADYFNGVADAGTIFKDKRALAVNRIKNAVLNGDIGGGGGVTPEIEAEIENAQWKTETSTQLFSETVNTETHEFGPIDGEITYTHTISADTIVVNFNAENYTCPVGYADGVYYYGAPLDPNTGSYVFTDFPFAISSGANDGGNYLATESPGSYTVSVSTENITYTDTFKNGVKANATMIVNFTPSGEGEYTADKTNNDIINAFYSGIAIIGYILGESSSGGNAGIPFSVERVITDVPTPEISFNALVVISGTAWIHRLSSFSDETGDGYEMMEIELTTTGGN